jgi:hypothetical protein
MHAWDFTDLKWLYQIKLCKKRLYDVPCGKSQVCRCMQVHMHDSFHLKMVDCSPSDKLARND